MISEQELRRIAARIGLGVGQCEHEYVLLCVLDILAQTPPLADTFCLKGGTALRLPSPAQLCFQPTFHRHTPAQ